MYIIKALQQCLSKFPQVRYEFEEEKKLTVFSNTNGFNIYIRFFEREHTLLFEKWHWHFSNNERENLALIETLMGIISNRAKVKVFKKFGKPYRWDMQLPNDQIHTKKKSRFVTPKWLLALTAFTIEYNTIQFL